MNYLNSVKFWFCLPIAPGVNLNPFLFCDVTGPSLREQGVKSFLPQVFLVLCSSCFGAEGGGLGSFVYENR